MDIINCINPTDTAKIDKIIKYLEWQKEQNIFYRKEANPLEIPQNIFKNKISAFEYNKHKGILHKYYYQQGSAYIKKKININYTDALYLLKNMILISGNVVWVSFGFNIGREFGGFHPAVILKNLGECLIVAPLTSGIKDPNNNRQIDVSKVYDFEIRDRYTDITRIKPISIYRIDLNNKIGNIHKKKLNEIKSEIINYWQNIFCMYL
ncbi:MAG: type II toxin-antitoxin system PemK/MazF family toxin [Oscillospiraceae bacterium]|nr:type II toxin-antitoxin system PemK/MazF family toxin [Oscillospiraceae bacterium]